MTGSRIRGRYRHRRRRARAAARLPIDLPSGRCGPRIPPIPRRGAARRRSKPPGCPRSGAPPHASPSAMADDRRAAHPAPPRQAAAAARRHPSPAGIDAQVDQSRHRQFVERHRRSEPGFEQPGGFRRFEQMHGLDPGGLPEQGQDRLEPGVRGLCRNLQGQGRGQHLLGGAQRVVKRDQPDPAEGGEIDHQRDNPGHEARGFVRPQGKLAPSAGSPRSDHWTAAASGSTSIP